MTYLAYKQEQEAPNYEQLGKLLSFKNEKARYRKTYMNWDKIKRANSNAIREKAKYLSKDAKDILAPVIQRLEKGERVFLNHKYISTITLCGRKQNTRIIKQLESILEITYHNSITVEGKKYRYSYEFSYYNQKNLVSEGHLTTSKMSRQNDLLYIIKENKNIEDIDLGSNFSQNSNNLILRKVISFKHKPLSNKRKKATNAQIKAKKAKLYRFNQYQEPKSLANHYPLSQEDCTRLQINSSREFTLNAMNQILLNMSKRSKESHHRFPSKATFMAYMSKVYHNESRDAVKTANTAFKITARASESEIIQHTTLIQRENYLNQVEQQAITHRSDETQYKARVAGQMPPNLAYNLLTNLMTVQKENNILKLIMIKDIGLTEHYKQILIDLANAIGSYRDVEKLEICI